MKSLYVVGGEQKHAAHARDEWSRFRAAVIAEVDLEKGFVERRVEYRSPDTACPDDDPSFVFKAGTLRGNLLYVCTQTEILIYRVPEFTRVGYVSLPCFNDLHHVIPISTGSLLVACTGLDLVAEVSVDGVLRRCWSVLGDDPWARFSRDVDYRRIPTTKPHRSHPNYLFEIGREAWVTRFEQRDAVCLRDLGRRIEIGIERPHDGVVFEGEVYFTTVDGHVVVADPGTGKVVRVHDLQALAPPDRLVGWTRALMVLARDVVVVGFSRLRRTRYLENLSWLKRRLAGVDARPSLPTRIALYDLVSKRVVWEHDLEPYDVNVVFSIHPAPAFR